jgi:hypothetical protein
MRRFDLLISVAAAAASLAIAGSAQASAFDTAVESTPGLLGYYTFTPTSQANSVVNGYTGVLENGAAIGGAGSGPPVNDPNSSALVLANGASGTAFATAGGTNPLQGQINQSGSIIGWIDLASLPSTQGRTFSIAGESQGGNDLDLQINSDNFLHFYTDSGGSAVDPTAFTASDLGNWVFIAATFTAGVDRTLYVNGVAVGSSTPGGHSLNTAPFYQGQSNVFSGRYFDGSLGDVALFNTDLTAAQVAALYAASLPTIGGVPEPATWALMLIGFAGLGGALRAGRRKSIVAEA